MNMASATQAAAAVENRNRDRDIACRSLRRGVDGRSRVASPGAPFPIAPEKLPDLR
jgi:hypothetical protein